MNQKSLGNIYDPEIEVEVAGKSKAVMWYSKMLKCVITNPEIFA